MITPLPHQDACLLVLEETRTLKHRDSALVVMAPGLGKTFTAAFDAHNFYYQNDFENKRILFLCHQNDILEQGKKAFQRVFGDSFHFGFFNGLKKQFHVKDGLFASFQSIKDSLEYFDRDYFTYIIVDESHHSMAATYKPVIDYFRPKFMLAITATPDRADLKDIRGIYGEEVFSISLEEALVRKLLTPVDYRLISDDFDEMKLEKEKWLPGRISIKDLNRKLFVPKRDEEIASIVKQHMIEIENSRTMMFCSTVQHCNHIVKYFEGAVAIHSRLPKKLQKERLAMFRRGEVSMIVTVDKFNEGIDVPEANLIIFLRSTNSHTIFLQQLGRGLRKFPGKDKVRILDFVGNCERLEMVRNLANRINRYSIDLNGSNSGRDEDSSETVYFELSSIHFTQTTLKILDVLAAIRSGYTKTILIAQLQDLATELGRSPTVHDISVASKAGLCASISTFSVFFGGINSALVAAGLEVNIKFWDSEEDLLNLLKDMALKLSRTPTQADVNEFAKNGLCPYAGKYRSAFGSYNSALKKAGLEPNNEMVFEKSSMILWLKQVAAEFRRSPSRREWNKIARVKNFPSAASYVTNFGSWENALKESGCESNMQRSYSKKELLKYLKAKAKKLGRTPSRREMDSDSKNGIGPASGIYRNHFGSWNEAIREAKLSVTKVINSSKEDIIKQLKSLAKKLGRTPSQSDLNKACLRDECVSSSTISKVFGSLPEAQKAAGLTKLVTYYSKEDLINHLVKLGKELGRAPSAIDLRKYSKLGKGPSPQPYSKHFSSHREALIAAKLIEEDSP